MVLGAPGIPNHCALYMRGDLGIFGAAHIGGVKTPDVVHVLGILWFFLALGQKQGPQNQDAESNNFFMEGSILSMGHSFYHLISWIQPFCTSVPSPLGSGYKNKYPPVLLLFYKIRPKLGHRSCSVLEDQLSIAVVDFRWNCLEIMNQSIDL